MPDKKQKSKETSSTAQENMQITANKRIDGKADQNDRHDIKKQSLGPNTKR